MLYTIGHSTRTADDFIALLQAHAVIQVADVRAYPVSRRLPHFNREALMVRLAQHGIGYRHIAALGGRRQPRPDSPNGAWQHPSFRGYADYMATRDFEKGLEELLLFAEAGATAVMCAEAVWWRCHRRLIADVLVARHVPVFHILSIDRVEAHEMTSFAVIRGNGVIYPSLLDLPGPLTP